MDPEVRFATVRSIGEECIEDGELRTLLTKKPQPVMYDGFEPSGRMHIAQGIFKAVNVNKATNSGCKFIFWVADWFALMNNKIGGDIEKIRTIGRYFVEVWKAAGMNMDHVEFRWASDSICGDASRYWPQMLDIARRFTLARVKKCCQIMGRAEGTLTAAQILYPLMQASDIFFLGADICQLGLDQRKVNMLARQYAAQIKGRHRPVILSHHMLAGLCEGQAKMSKSNPDSAVFMEDTAEDVIRKIGAAYCPPPSAAVAAPATAPDAKPAATGGDADDEDADRPETTVVNPVLDYVKCLCFGEEGATFTVGGTAFASYAEVEAAYGAGTITADALREALAAFLNVRLQPVRDALASPELGGLLDEVKSIRAQLAADEAKKAPPPTLTVKTLKLEKASSAMEGSGAESKRVTVLVMPTATPSLVTALRTLTAVVSLVEAGAEVTVVVQSWAGLAANVLDGDLPSVEAAAAAWRDVFAKLTEAASQSCSALTREGALTVTLEHELILRDVNSFWLSAIHTGRSVMLSEAESVLGIAAEGAPAGTAAAAGSAAAAMPDASPVGLLVAALMSTAAVAANPPAAVVATHPLHVASSQFLEKAVGFIESLAKAGVSGEGNARVVPVVDATLSAANDVGVVLWENDATAAPKLKKTFCAPGDVETNPPLELLRALVGARLVSTPVTVARPAEHGGDAKFDTVDALGEAFKGETVHPGDLKALVKGIVGEVRVGDERRCEYV